MNIPSWLYWYIAISVVIIICVDILRRIFNYRALLAQPSVLIELTPPAISLKAPHSTEQLLQILVIGSGSTFKDRFMGRAGALPLEVVSSRGEGIRFLARIPQSDVGIFTQQLAAYMPEVKFKEVPDYMESAFTDGQSISLMEFKQARHFMHPLASHDALAQHDPIAYITGSMTKLDQNELIVYQLVLSSIRPREASRIRNRIMLGKEPISFFSGLPLFFRILAILVSIPFRLLGLVVDIISEMSRPTDQASMSRYNDRLKQEQTAIHTPEYQNLLAGFSDKLGQPLFQVSIRAMVVSNNKARSQQGAAGIDAALASFGVQGYQGLVSKRSFPWRLRYPYRLWSLKHRLPAPFMSHASILSAAEVASLYHFPYGNQNTAENVMHSHSRSLPAPAALKRRADHDEFDVVFGENHHHGHTTPIGLTASERERHLYIIGGTGNGKTTLLQYAIVQDMQKGKGVAVVDPHGDMAEMLLRHVPKERIKDVVYFNPDDLEHPFAMNLLELTPGLTGNALLREKDLITESVVSVFRKIFSEEDTGGHRIEYVLRNAIHTALTVEGATLFTILKLLQNATYRKKVTDSLEDEDLKDFWKNEMGQAGNMQRVKMSAGITAKIGRFNSNAAAKLILGQEKSTIDFEEIIDSGKILICNFSKGLLGEDVSELFGITILAKLQLASLRRARIKQQQRRPFYLYVDEFQNFATPSFVQMLSESRKYKVYLTIAEQSTSQQKDQQMVSIILANVGTVICFRTGNPNDERLLLPLFKPSIEEGEIANLSAYNFYTRLSSLIAQEPLSGETLLITSDEDEAVAEAVIVASRESYAAKAAPLEPQSGKPKKTTTIKGAKTVREQGEPELASAVVTLGD